MSTDTMTKSTVAARHRSDITATDAIRAGVRVIRPRTAPEPQHRGGMPPAVGAGMMVLAAVAASAITTLGLVR